MIMSAEGRDHIALLHHGLEKAAVIIRAGNTLIVFTRVNEPLAGNCAQLRQGNMLELHGGHGHAAIRCLQRIACTHIPVNLILLNIIIVAAATAKRIDEIKVKGCALAIAAENRQVIVAAAGELRLIIAHQAQAMPLIHFKLVFLADSDCVVMVTVNYCKWDAPALHRAHNRINCLLHLVLQVAAVKIRIIILELVARENNEIRLRLIHRLFDQCQHIGGGILRILCVGNLQDRKRTIVVELQRIRLLPECRTCRRHQCRQKRQDQQQGNRRLFHFAHC